MAFDGLMVRNERTFGASALRETETLAFNSKSSRNKRSEKQKEPCRESDRVLFYFGDVDSMRNTTFQNFTFLLSFRL